MSIFANMKRAIVIGASSGIGRQVAQLLIQDGWHVGMASRRIDTLNELKAIAPDRIHTRRIDVTEEDAPKIILELINELGGLNLYFHAAGVGWRNPDLDPEKELRTMEINAVGFTRTVGAAFRYFAEHAGGQIAVITSIAGTKGLGPAPAYSASKALQNKYIQALDQVSHEHKLHITFTDIRPGFVNTPLLFPETLSTMSGSTSTQPKFPMLMTSQSVAKHIIKAIYRKKRVVVIDWRWRILTALWKLIPNCIWRRMKLSNA